MCWKKGFLRMHRPSARRHLRTDCDPSDRPHVLSQDVADLVARRSASSLSFGLLELLERSSSGVLPIVASIR